MMLLCMVLGHRWKPWGSRESEWIAGGTSAGYAHHRRCRRCGYVEND